MCRTLRNPTDLNLHRGPARGLSTTRKNAPDTARSQRLASRAFACSSNQSACSRISFTAASVKRTWNFLTCAGSDPATWQQALFAGRLLSKSQSLTLWWLRSNLVQGCATCVLCPDESIPERIRSECSNRRTRPGLPHIVSKLLEGKCLARS